MTAVNASTLGDENVENSKKLQQAVVGSKTVKADGTVDTGNTPALTTAIDAANKKIETALKATTANTDKYDKTALDTALNTATGLITKVLEDKNISKSANESFNVLQDKLEELKKLNSAANDANGSSDANITKLNALKTGIEEVSAAFEEAYNITNSQMTSLDELRTTLQGFVAKPNDVNLGYTSFTTFLLVLYFSKNC